MAYSGETLLDQTLKRSVDEVRNALPALIKERDELQQRILELNRKIGAAGSFISAMSGSVATATASTTVALEPMTLQSSAVVRTPQVRKRASAGMVYTHVHKFLLEAGKTKQARLMNELEKHHGVRYGHSSVYRALTRGRDMGYYANDDDGNWKVTAKGKAVEPERVRETA